MEEPIVWFDPVSYETRSTLSMVLLVSLDGVEGRNGDGWLLGAMAALWGRQYLIENLFGSDPDDFQEWGVYRVVLSRRELGGVCAVVDAALSGFTPEGEEPTGPQCLYRRCVDPGNSGFNY